MRGRSGHRAGAFAGAFVLGLMLACSRGYESTDAEGNRVVASEDLIATMEIETVADAVRLTLHVTNRSAEPIQLEFTSGQRFDFQVARMDNGAVGEPLWTWSADKSFLQALSTETLAPGGSLRYSAEWPAGGVTGNFIAHGSVTSTNHPVRQSARFELAGNE